MIWDAQFRSSNAATRDEFSGPNTTHDVSCDVEFSDGELAFRARFEGIVRSSLVAHGSVIRLSSDYLALVCHGQTYLCQLAGTTASCTPIDVQPTTAIDLCTDHSLLVLTDFTRVHAYDAQGERVWISDRVSDDGIRNLYVDERHAHLEGWDAPRRRWIPVTLDLEDGQET